MVKIEITQKGNAVCYAEDMDLRIYTAQNLSIIRKEKGFSQTKLADASGVSVSMVAKLEQNITSPSADVLKKLGEALNIFFVIVWGELDENTAILFRNSDN